MADSKNSKEKNYKEGRNVKVSTFKGWGYGDTIGYHQNGDKVEYIWCKLCSKHKEEIKSSIQTRGKVKEDQLSYTKEVRFIKKGNVERHLQGNCHTLALNIEAKINKRDGEGSSTIEPPSKQPKIDDAIKNASQDQYEKMFKVAYNLAEGMMPFNKYHVLVKCLRDNKVKLISGKDDHRAAEEFVRFIADSIRERLAVLLCSSNAFSILSDGSEARKTGLEKELVFVRLVRGGVPVYYCVSLQDCGEYGGVDADSLKGAIDDIFESKLKRSDTNQNTVLQHKFEKVVVSATADGASVNFGKYSGLLTQLKESRAWLVSIHCVAHRAELSLKDYLLDVSEFKKLDDTMIGLFNLFKKSGKLKRAVKKKAKEANVDAYVMPKVTGTRFVGHRLNAVKVFLHNWAIYGSTFRKEIDERPHSDNVRSKLIGYMKILDDFKMRCAAVLFRRILSICSHLQYQFEKGNILVFEIPEKIDGVIDDLQTLIDEYTSQDVDESEEKSSLEKYGNCIMGKDANFGADIMSVSLPKAGHMRRKIANREYKETKYGIVKQVKGSFNRMKTIVKNDIPGLMNAYRARFESFESPIFKSMLWMNPANWDLSDPKYGIEDLKYLANHFEIPLGETKFSIDNIEHEWKSFKRLCSRNYAKVKSPLSFWHRILTYRQEEYRNICLIAEICLSIGSSNSTVERGFSKLTTLLTDKRLSMSHLSMENCLLIAANASAFSEDEKDIIIKDAVRKYLRKQRRLPSYIKNKKILLMTEESSDDDTDLEEVEVAALAALPNSDQDDSDVDHMEDDMPDDMSMSENSDIEEGNIDHDV